MGIAGARRSRAVLNLVGGKKMNSFASQQRRNYITNALVGGAARATFGVGITRALVAASDGVAEYSIFYNTITVFCMLFAILMVNPILFYRASVGLIQRLDAAFSLESLSHGIVGLKREIILDGTPTDLFMMMDRILSRIPARTRPGPREGASRVWRVQFHEVYDVIVTLDDESRNATLEVVGVRQKTLRWFYFVDTSSVVILCGVLWVGCSERLLRLEPPLAGERKAVVADLRHVLKSFGEGV